MVRRKVKEEDSLSNKENEKKEIVLADEIGEYVRENWNESQLDVLVNLFSLSCHDGSDFMVRLSLFLHSAVATGAIGEDELSVIGIDANEVSSLTEAVSDSSSFEELKMDLYVRAAVRVYEKEIMDIMRVNKLNLERFEEFKALIARFSADNSITDIKAAYRFLEATEGGSVEDFKIGNN